MGLAAIGLVACAGPAPLPTTTLVPTRAPLAASPAPVQPAAPTNPPAPAAAATAAAPSVPAQATVDLSAPYDANADPAKDIAAALVAAQAGHKYVLLDFGANWCPDCLVLAQLFEDPAVKPFLEAHFVVARVDVGQWDRNLDIAARYDNPIAVGIPAVVVLDTSGKMVATTKAGELANARTATAQDILACLQKWAPK